MRVPEARTRVRSNGRGMFSTERGRSEYLRLMLLSAIRVAYLADPGQWISDEHVYHAGAAELGVHDDHARGLLAYLADDLGFLAAFCVAQGSAGGVSDFGGYYGEEFAFVGDVERVYA